MKKIIVAIDGYSSSGKSTIAKELAREVGYIYIDTGAMYRAVSLYGIRNGWITEKEMDIQQLEDNIKNIHIEFKTDSQGNTQTFLNGENVEGEIRSLTVANGASRVSTLGFVREELVRRQQEMGKDKGIVMDGRDIGTVVFPDAELKIFMTASPETRAERRMLELNEKGLCMDYESVLKNIQERDVRDTTRKESPLKRAEDAVEIDNSILTPEEQRQLVRTLFSEKML